MVKLRTPKMERVNNKLENIFKEKIKYTNSIGGGCIADSRKVETDSGKLFFIKQYAKPDIHGTEANGLLELKKARTINIPNVIYFDDDILVLEYIEEGKRRENFSEIFGKQIAMLHKYNSDKFGFLEDNYCGATVQKNTPLCDNWVDFYFTNRLLFQYKLAEKNNYVTFELKNAFAKLEKRIKIILDGSNEKPSLLHGDLWGGNYLVDKNGNPCLIDPAVYYGNREADLAMTKLFGGFNSEFYKSYQIEYPLQEGWQYRENIYKLYHIFNHLNLFGMTYYNQVLSLIKSYL